MPQVSPSAASTVIGSGLLGELSIGLVDIGVESIVVMACSLRYGPAYTSAVRG